MRIYLLLCGAVLPALFWSSSLAAQQFPAPSDEELKMTADPKAPGADAVILELRESDDDQRHFRTYYERIKVLTEKGKDLASIEIPFIKGDSKVREIKARTIHSDGTVFPLQVKPEDLLVEKTKDLQVKRKVFTLPNVEIGSILEYQYDVVYGEDSIYAPHWSVQRSYYAHKEHFDFLPGARLMYVSRLPDGVQVKQKAMGGVFTLDAEDVPAAPDEDWMPPVDSFYYGVTFFYSTDFDQVAYWKRTTKEWADAVDDFATPTKTLKAAVAELVGANDSDLEKAKKIYAAVQALDNTDFSRAKSASERRVLKLKEEKRAEDTWKQKSGTANALALLYLAMLRAAGLTAYAVEVADRDRGTFDPAYLSFDQLDSILVVLDNGGKQTLLDPGEKMCPFGTFDWRHAMAAGIGEFAKGPSFGKMPSLQYSDTMTRRTGTLTLTASGGVSGQIQIEMTGQESLRWRQYALRNDESEVKKQFEKELADIVPDGVEAHVDHFEGMDDPAAKLIATVNITGSLGAVASKRLLLPSYFFETRGHVPFVNEEKRWAPVDMLYPEYQREKIIYRLPPGLTVEGAPQTTSIAWSGHALLQVESEAAPGQITMGQTLTRAFTVVKSEDYQDLRGFYQKVAAADQEQVVLTMTTAANSH